MFAKLWHAKMNAGHSMWATRGEIPKLFLPNRYKTNLFCSFAKFSFLQFCPLYYTVNIYNYSYEQYAYAAGLCIILVALVCIYIIMYNGRVKKSDLPVFCSTLICSVVRPCFINHWLELEGWAQVCWISVFSLGFLCPSGAVVVVNRCSHNS